MHNLHFIRTKAKDPETAIIDVDSAIENWGNENNYRRVFGCVNKRGKITIVDEEARWADVTYKETKRILEEVYSNPGIFAKELWKRVLNGEEPKDFEWWPIKKYAEWHMHRKWAGNPKKFNIWKDTFADWDLSEVGLTDLETSDDGKNYIVFVDMHS